jgi:hypothetical protein
MPVPEFCCRRRTGNRDHRLGTGAVESREPARTGPTRETAGGRHGNLPPSRPSALPEATVGCRPGGSKAARQAALLRPAPCEWTEYHRPQPDVNPKHIPGNWKERASFPRRRPDLETTPRCCSATVAPVGGVQPVDHDRRLSISSSVMPWAANPGDTTTTPSTRVEAAGIDYPPPSTHPRCRYPRRRADSEEKNPGRRGRTEAMNLRARAERARRAARLLANRTSRLGPGAPL